MVYTYMSFSLNVCLRDYFIPEHRGVPYLF